MLFRSPMTSSEPSFSMRKITKLVRVCGGAALILTSGACSSWCRNDLRAEKITPNGQTKAVVFDRDCGGAIATAWDPTWLFWIQAPHWTSMMPWVICSLPACQRAFGSAIRSLRLNGERTLHSCCGMIPV